MSDDNWIDRAQEEAKLRFGRELDADELAKKLLEHGLDARVNHLKTLRDDGEQLTIHAAAKRTAISRKLFDAHHAARRAGR